MERCDCVYENIDGHSDYWSSRKQQNIVLDSGAEAVYKAGSISSGIVVVSDAIGTEIQGSRQMIESLSLEGHHVIKPMLFQDSEQHIEFLELIAAYYVSGMPKKETPSVIRESVEFLKKSGAKTIGLLGLCWGSCLVQNLICIDDSFTSACCVDGIYRDESFAALAPSYFLLGQSSLQGKTCKDMTSVMWSNNIYPWSMDIRDYPLQHGFIFKGISYEAGRLNTEKRRKDTPLIRQAKDMVIEGSHDAIAKIIDFFKQYHIN